MRRSLEAVSAAEVLLLQLLSPSLLGDNEPNPFSSGNVDDESATNG